MTIPDPDKILPKLEKDGIEEVRKKLSMGVYAKHKMPVIEEWLQKTESVLNAPTYMYHELEAPHGKVFKSSGVPELERKGWVNSPDKFGKSFRSKVRSFSSRLFLFGKKNWRWIISTLVALIIPFAAANYQKPQSDSVSDIGTSQETPNNLYAQPQPVVAQQKPHPVRNQQRYEKPVPRRDENDVLIPLIILQSIPGFDESKTVYAATYKNNWLNIPTPENEAEVIENSIMERKSNEWRAINLAGTRFQPVQLKNPNLSENKFKPGNISWPLIEDLHKVYGDTWEKFSKEFLDNQELCFLIP